MEWVLSILACTGMGIEDKNVVLLLNTIKRSQQTTPMPSIPSYDRNTGNIGRVKLKLRQMEAGPTLTNLQSNVSSCEKLLEETHAQMRRHIYIYNIYILYVYKYGVLIWVWGFSVTSSLNDTIDYF
jgi:hypothetical protein